MEFTFDAEQEYQLNAINAVTGIFEGQARHDFDMTTSALSGLAVLPNRLDIHDEAVLQNVQAIQVRNNLRPDRTLFCIEERILGAQGMLQARFPNFSLEMETGTGKTYVYLRTVMELFKHYGLRKYMIVVPSVAVREGVLKTLQVTEKHFRALYSTVVYRYYRYDSNSLTHVRQFALSDGIEIMVMTLDSFNKSSNLIYQSTDRLQGETPMHMLQATRPILLLDEPQNMESALSITSLATFHPLFALRYSATHRNPYNLVYRLTPYEAYRQGLVKRIEVASVVQEIDASQAFLRLISITPTQKVVTAQLAIHKLMKDGSLKEQIVTMKPGDSLEEKSGRKAYEGYEIREINPGYALVLFANGTEITVGETQGADKEAIFKAQIFYTLEEHFQRQMKLRALNIKVLSLFFIDRVENYRSADSLIRRLFRQAFLEMRDRFARKDPTWKDLDPEDVQKAYFAQRKTKNGDVILEDSSSGESEKDKDAYDLILKDKERLLSFAEPTAFLFSHSALREGWDNPNVFQICTLNQTVSDRKKRQEVGRGARLAVDQTGKRIKDERVNILTIIANQSYESYVSQLQSEVADVYGEEGMAPQPANARERRVALLRKEYTLKPEFEALWNAIKYRTRYSVQIQTDQLISDVVKDVDQRTIAAPQLSITKARVDVGVADAFETLQMGSGRTAIRPSSPCVPNVIDLMDRLMEYTTPPVSLTRSTLLRIVQQVKNKRSILLNPYAFASETVRVIKEKLADQLVDGIQYTRIDQWYEMSQLEPEIESWQEFLVPAPHSVYDHVLFDSTIEKDFVEGLEKRDDVLLYLKLPAWFKVPTPIGTYNPDWAIVVEERDAHGNVMDKPLLYLVRETKGTRMVEELRPDERRKILCGHNHFERALGVSYRVVTNSHELLL